MRQTAKSSATWKHSKQFYKEYVDTDPSVSIETEGLDEPAREKMARLFSGVDQRIMHLSRVLGNQDSFPDNGWYEQILDRFPWINGVAAVDKQGTILVARPEETIKPQNFDVLLDENEVYGKRTIRARVDETPFGPEFYMGGPFFNENTLQGLVAVHFDFRSLLQFSPAPDDLMVLTEQGIVWPGSGFDEKALAELPWGEFLRNDVHGNLKLNKREYYWISRYVGQMRLIYVVRES
ncbi:MAG: hypothetical protein ACLFNV_04940 [Desulfovibrionales bacterium]